MPDDTDLANSIYISNALRMPKDANVGQVQYSPEALAEHSSGARQALMAGAMLPIAGAEAGAGGLARLLADRRVNAMFTPAQKQFWKLFGKRAAD
jgi:hypothetical protein